MDHKAEIHASLQGMANILLDFITQTGQTKRNGWVPAPYIKRELDLLVLCYPKNNVKQHGRKGWLFSILARMLEDAGQLEYRFDGKNAHYRAVPNR